MPQQNQMLIPCQGTNLCYIIGMEAQITADSTKPSRTYPGRKMISLVLPDDLVAALDKHAKYSDVSRTWVIRKILQGWVDDQREGY
jgi:Ribbon-helix-helix protein, copG family